MEHLLLILIFTEFITTKKCNCNAVFKSDSNIIILKSRRISRKFATMKLLFFIGVSEELLFKMNCTIWVPYVSNYRKYKTMFFIEIRHYQEIVLVLRFWLMGRMFNDPLSNYSSISNR